MQINENKALPTPTPFSCEQTWMNGNLNVLACSIFKRARWVRNGAYAKNIAPQRICVLLLLLFVMCQKGRVPLKTWWKRAYVQFMGAYTGSEQSKQVIERNSEKMSEIDNALKDECQLVEHTEYHTDLNCNTRCKLHSSQYTHIDSYTFNAFCALNWMEYKVVKVLQNTIDT